MSVLSPKRIPIAWKTETVASSGRSTPGKRRQPSSMSMWSKIFGGSARPDKVDYYEEALTLSREGKFHEALTSLRLALKESPGDPIVLQQIAIAYTRMGMDSEALKTYRHVLDRNPQAPGAHYGIAFILRRQGNQADAVEHLEAFLAGEPPEPDAAEHIAHARRTLDEIRGTADADGEEP